MSFSQSVREELIKHYSRQEHLRRAELAALMMFAGRSLTFDKDSGKYIYTDPRAGEDADPQVSRKVYSIKGRLDSGSSLDKILAKSDDKRAFLRGAYIASGTISDPRKDYHFEIACPDMRAAGEIVKCLEYFDITAKVQSGRSQRQVVYFKESDNISLVLNVMEAVSSMMEFENIHIERELKGVVNRRVNCDTANINKTIAAGARQISDIELVRDTIGFENLEDGLRDICIARLENPDASLAELAELLTPKVGKSGANHRLRKISKMAEDIRKKER